MKKEAVEDFDIYDTERQNMGIRNSMIADMSSAENIKVSNDVIDNLDARNVQK